MTLRRSSTFTIRPMLCIRIFFIFCEILLICTFAREADERSQFLYTNDPAAVPVKEYQIHTAPSGDYEEDPQGKVHGVRGGEDEEEKNIKPYFLKGGDNGPRIVQFYSPWSGNCQIFKRRYIELAQEVTRRNLVVGTEVEFHAISCSAHHYVCMEAHITTYPTVVAFKAGSNQGVKLNRFTAEIIADAVGVSLKGSGNRPMNKRKDDAAGSFEFNKLSGEGEGAVDILGAASMRVKKETYSDAALSFTFALKTELFRDNMSGIGVDIGLSREEQYAFAEWIDLLYWTLPPTWLLHTLINDLRNNIDTVLVSKDDMNWIVNKNEATINGDLKDKQWTKSCSHGKDGAGYSCGLWNLLHIVSIGVAERYNAVLGARDRVSVYHAGETLRNYIAHFFGCAICQKNFIQMHDECAHSRCKRFRQMKNPTKSSWKELAIWVWEVHNDVNMMLMRERTERQGHVATKAEEESVLWPSRKQCGQCWRSDNTFDRDMVYSFLKKEYWPGGVQNFRYVVLNQKAKDDDEYSFEKIRKLLPRAILGTIALMFIASSLSKRNLARSGKHKKHESDCV